MKHPTLFVDSELSDAIKSEYRIYLNDRDRVKALTIALERRRNEPVSAYSYASALEAAMNMPFGYVSAIDLIENKEEEVFAMSKDLELAQKRISAREAAFSDLRLYYGLSKEKSNKVFKALFENLILGKPFKQVNMSPATLAKYKHTLIYFCAKRYEEDRLWRSNTPKKNPHIRKPETKQ